MTLIIVRCRLAGKGNDVIGFVHRHTRSLARDYASVGRWRQQKKSVRGVVLPDVSHVRRHGSRWSASRRPPYRRHRTTPCSAVRRRIHGCTRRDAIWHFARSSISAGWADPTSSGSRPSQRRNRLVATRLRRQHRAVEERRRQHDPRTAASSFRFLAVRPRRTGISIAARKQAWEESRR